MICCTPKLFTAFYARCKHLMTILRAFKDLTIKNKNPTEVAAMLISLLIVLFTVDDRSQANKTSYVQRRRWWGP